MKALQITKYGKAESALRLLEAKRPQLQANEILVHVMACGINPVDYKMVHGHYKLVQRIKFPATLGYDVAGVVVELGTGVTHFSKGDRVFGCAPTRKPGTIAEYYACEASYLVPIPDEISFTQAAAMPLAGMTVLQCFQRAGIKEGASVLIHAGSGGVGSIAIQWAKSLGINVFTTTSSKNIDWVAKLGADRVIAYDREDYTEIDTQFDMVLDALGGIHSFNAIPLLKKGGTLVNIAGGLDAKAARLLGVPWLFVQLIALQRRRLINKLKSEGKKYEYVLMIPDSDDMRSIAQALSSKKITPVIDRVYPFDQSVAAFTYLESGRAKGKIVIELADL